MKLASLWVLGIDLLTWDTNPVPYVREINNRKLAGWFKQIYVAGQGEDTDRNHPWKKDWFDTDLQLHRFQSTPKPLHWLYWALDLNSPEYRAMKRDCTNSDVIRQFESMEEIHRRNPVQSDAQLGGTRREVKPTTSPIFMATAEAPNKMNMEWAIREGMQLYIDGSQTDKEDFRLYGLMLTLLALMTEKSITDRTGETPGIHVVHEEAGATELNAGFIVDAKRTLRYARGYVDTITQALSDLGDTASGHLQNSPLILSFKSTSDEDVQRISNMLTMASFDPRETRWQTTRSINKGVREIKTKTVSRTSSGGVQKQFGTKDRVSKNEGENVSEGTAFIQDTELVTDDHYVEPEIKRHDYSKNLYGFSPGCGYELLDGVVRKFYRPMLANPWDNKARFSVKGLPGEELFPTGEATLYEYRFRMAVESQHERFPFIQRSTWQPSQKRSAQAPTPTQATPKGERGLKRSGG